MELNEFTNEELCEIYENLNSWKWDPRVCEEPEGWEKLPKYNRHWYHKVLGRKTKVDYIDPILILIKEMVPEKEISRYHNVNVLKISNEAFERWWKRNGEFHSNWWQ